MAAGTHACMHACVLPPPLYAQLSDISNSIQAKPSFELAAISLTRSRNKNTR